MTDIRATARAASVLSDALRAALRRLERIGSTPLDDALEEGLMHYEEGLISYGTGEIAAELALAMQDGEEATVAHHVRSLTARDRARLRRLFVRLSWRLGSEQPQPYPAGLAPYRDPDAAE
jgi:hypothetical protein